MNEYVERILREHLPSILGTDGVVIPDNEEEMNWRIFFAHSQDMQGFRADIFTGGANEGKNPYDPAFVGLRERWGSDSRSLIADLARVWDHEYTKAELTRMSNPLRPREEKQNGVGPAIKLLHDSGVRGARVFAETVEALRGPRIARKTNGTIRSYVQNSHLLKKHNCSFRAYLQSILPGQPLPPRDVPQAEVKWRAAVERDFYGVGPALANYMICDWLLWLWREGRIDWFDSYKADSVHLTAVKERRLPPAAADDFVAYCRSIYIPAGYGALSGRLCPPRVLNECIWLDMNRSSAHIRSEERAAPAPTGAAKRACAAAA